MKKLLFITSFVLLLAPTISFAAITFTNGYWSTTYNCADWIGSSDGSTLCDGIEPVYATTQTPDGHYCTMNATSNYSGGGGGKGFRYWARHNATNVNTGEQMIQFPSNLYELWIRWYMRYVSGYVSGYAGQKMIYMLTAGPANNLCLGMFEFLVPAGGSGPNQYWTNARESDVFPSGVSDESWHCYEVHYKGETTANATDGYAELWIDGTYKGLLTGYNFGIITKGGWYRFLMPSNNSGGEDSFGGLPVSGTPAEGWIDFDDLAVATTAYTGFVQDAGGRKMIGPIGLGPNPPPGPPKNLRIISP